MKSCIILCGGQSRRMGQDKGLMTLNKDPMIIQTMKIVERIVDEIILVLRDEKQLEAYQQYIEDFKIQRQKNNTEIIMVTDVEKDQGPLLGLCTGLTYIKSEGALTLPCDSPFISSSFVNKMFEMVNGVEVQAIVPVWPNGSTEPLHAYYSRECIPLIKDRVKNGFRNVKSLLDIVNVAYIEVSSLDPDKKSFINLNRPEDVSQYRE
ncbi:MAG: molybdenum cofactor guanylyltransferase [Methanobacterium sp.]|mgnify:CR=1 FL=1|jgi:molybdopterin-guanine dinucleotide biosynthesis protein A|uniref:molybdenum cofactor guanylyltransferase n=1 Tax=Methanobacterium sp. TaxID=2164 RepID=UPI0003C9F022|nr:molybdenum cofactor guanylyltransferase [Methanobacterium sp.]MDI3550085.1 molybdenum cofactor guanylyltransferase [Methanobacterium sp.]CDG65025.1 molybdopterin-guanine dinucleotide biosynthesis protein A [Methanobacterium sp. MB1]